MSIEQRLAELGITLPEPPPPVAAYVPGVISGNMLYVSGQLPSKAGKLEYTGRLGRDLDVEKGQQAARTAGINCLGVLKSLLGDLDRVQRIVKLTGYVQSADDFFDQPKVVNGASELMQEVFGSIGQHARAAVGVNSLPLNAACEIELIAEFK